MSERQKFEFQDDVGDTWEIIDRLSRMVWERKQFSSERKIKVNDAAAAFHTEMRMASQDLPRREPKVRLNPPRGADVDSGQGGGWRPFTVDKLAKLVVSKDIGSVAEAFLKATPVLDAIRQTVGYAGAGFVFRGQRNIEWPLVPTLARNEKFLAHFKAVGEVGFLEGNQSKTSTFEHEMLGLFKENWAGGNEIDQIDLMTDIAAGDPSWWFRMQHYGEISEGTRLLDVTSSIPAALLFSCLNWDTGLIDDTTDGILYLFVEGLNAKTVDFADTTEDINGENLFDAYYKDAPIYFLNPPHNERSKAQSGAFLWWPKFWEPFNGQILYLRVLKERKQDIVRELLLLNFGPKDIVRGQKGSANEVALRKSLGL